MSYFTPLFRRIFKPRMKHLALVAAVAMTGYAQEGIAQTNDSDEPLFYGFRGYSANTTDETNLGLYTITATGETEMVWPDQLIGANGTYVAVMWPQNGELHTLFGNASSYYHFVFDFENGELLRQTQIDVSGDNAYKYIRRGAYNPKDGYIYGYSWSADETEDYFVKTPASNPSKVTIIREMPKDFVACAANCFNPEDNCMYGVDTYKSLIRVDVHGNFSYTNLLLPTQKNLHGVVTGMVYSPKDHCFYWDARYTDYTSEFIKIDPTNTREIEVNGVTETVIVAENVSWFYDFDAYVSMFTFDTTGTANGPVAPEMVSFNIATGEKSGNIVYKMPTQLANGGEAPASMKWEATVGKENTQTGTAAPGENVTVNYTDLSNGEQTFWFRAYNGDAPGVLEVNTAWIGNDVPRIPENVTFAPTNTKDEYIIKWDPVTKGAHNGYLDTEKLRYVVFLDGNERIAEVTENQATVEIKSTDDEVGCYAVVYAVAGNLVSEPGYSSMIYIGNGWLLPYSIAPASYQVEMMTYINPEGDKLGWRPFMCPPDIPTFYSGNSDTYPGNDWLITPHLQFPDKEAIYEISYDVAIWNASYQEEYYDIWIGTEPTIEGIMMQQILPKTRPESMMFENNKVTFKVPEAGTYYIGFRCLSEPKQGGILLKSIKIKQATGGNVAEIDDNGVSVIGEKGLISVKGGDNLPIAIYSIDGRCLYSGTVSGEGSYSMRPGVYVAVCDGKSFKVVVK